MLCFYVSIAADLFCFFVSITGLLYFYIYVAANLFHFYILDADILRSLHYWCSSCHWSLILVVLFYFSLSHFSWGFILAISRSKHMGYSILPNGCWLFDLNSPMSYFFAVIKVLWSFSSALRFYPFFSWCLFYCFGLMLPIFISIYFYEVTAQSGFHSPLFLFILLMLYDLHLSNSRAHWFTQCMGWFIGNTWYIFA